MKSWNNKNPSGALPLRQQRLTAGISHSFLFGLVFSPTSCCQIPSDTLTLWDSSMLWLFVDFFNHFSLAWFTGDLPVGTFCVRVALMRIELRLDREFSFGEC